MKKTCLVLALLLCCASVLLMTGCETESNATITGTVTFLDGTLAADVWVDADLVGQSAGVKTDSEGRYIFEHAQHGNWTVRVAGCNWPWHELFVDADKEYVLDIVMPCLPDELPSYREQVEPK